MKLLANGKDNTKLNKSVKRFSRFDVYSLSLYPNKLICESATKECLSLCLKSAGMGVFPNVINGRQAKTIFFMKEKEKFLVQLKKEITNSIKRSAKRKRTAAFRLNMMSDVDWLSLGIPQAFPNAQFYDYTKVAGRCFRQLPANYHLTFSHSGENLEECKRILGLGLANIAVVFKDSLPKRWLGKKVIDGTTHDMRFLDPKGVIVGLVALGKAKKAGAESKFVVTHA